MHRLHRPALKRDLQAFLDYAQQEVTPETEVAGLWKKKRKLAAMRMIADVLARMAGPRARCMFCQDSLGTDIEHFRPKQRFRELLFRWPNLILTCAACNRVKKDRFPLDRSGLPLLIDPTTEDPWDHLFFDRKTSLLTARWVATSGLESPKGVETLSVIATLNHEAVGNGRARVVRNLVGAVEDFLQRTGVGSVPKGVEDAAGANLRERVLELLDYGLAEWFFVRDGQAERPFAELRVSFPAQWEKIQQAILATRSPCREDDSPSG